MPTLTIAGPGRPGVGALFPGHPAQNPFSRSSQTPMQQTMSQEPEMPKHYEIVPIEKLRWQCDEFANAFQSTDEIDTFRQILGQERAVEALKAGFEMDYPGYNIFVAGAAGTGRTTTVRFLLQDDRFKREVPPDICYVNNFRAPDMPLAIILPAGQGSSLKKEMDDLIVHLRAAIPQVMESDRTRDQRDKLAETYTRQQNKNLHRLEEKARKENFTLVQVQVGPYTKPDVLPVIDNQPVTLEGLGELLEAGKISEKQIKKIHATHVELTRELARLYKTNQKLQREKKAKLAELEQSIIRPLIEESLSELRPKYPDAKLGVWFDSVRDHLLETLDLFRHPGAAEEAEPKPDKPSTVLDAFLEYRINVLVDNAGRDRAPVIFENTPTMSRLFGAIERLIDGDGQWRSDFTRIRAGSLLRANGGYLVLQAMDVLQEPGAWHTLKRVLKNRATEISASDQLAPFALTALKPEAIEIHVKVIIIGDPYLYQLLYHADDDFQKIFKIKAEFDSVMPNNPYNLKHYAGFIKRICDDQELLPFDASAVSEVAEHGVRLTGRQNKLTTRFTHIADLLREAHHQAIAEDADIVEKRHVERALGESRHRLNLVEEKIHEQMIEGTVMIDSDGAKVGQVNGLSVLSTGDYHFGQPSRITAQTAMGRQGIVNIEHEAALSGPTHDKGVLILSSYLQSRFAQDKPLCINASLCFEQSYGGVDGDSASSTEIYALLSRLADVPIRQDLAVTGSVNQNGEIQPIGGVNEKIEGFYRLCKARGLTGTQGVLIPRLNVPDLMLDNEVVDAASRGLFTIYAVDTVEGGIEILTGMPAGERDAGGAWPEQSIYGRVDKRLDEYAEGWRKFQARA